MLSFELFPYSSTVKNILGILEYMYKVASGVFSVNMKHNLNLINTGQSMIV